ncbi:MAG TPA: tRNA (guanosine(37)-N1)-methyltransferase TrmD [candidate division WOR-3 bacterium]|uniref:tRNA (guanine-N(1)-)-methyltransferase n=1 Tax=candidate division WOR-3 bacterium TaxID=2052148 RepID=A0A7V0T776_UNCW3|nr:tRNA (guanosine(37)-N1)-methyltransferase TrmD [candidate division WOR-3 bacterium]
MRVHLVSLFPEYFSGPFDCGTTRIARLRNLIEVETVNPRDFTDDAHRTVDDHPFGGGAGMVLKPEPLYRTVESVRTPASRVVLLSPKGRRYDQALAREFSRLEHLVLVCGRYKGVDERVCNGLCDDEVSVGDYVLAGGEAAAVIVVESIARLLPGAVGDAESVDTDSFETGLLDTPWFTRPRRFRDAEVPEVLVTGDHAAVARWRREQSLLATARHRPDLLGDETLSEPEREFLMLHLTKEMFNGESS